MKNTVRKALVPRMALVRMTATSSPPTLMAMVVTTTKAQLYQKAWVKVLSPMARTKLLRPMRVASRTVVNWQKARYTPSTKGMMKPMTNAARVGRTKMGQYFLIARCTVSPPLL